MSGKKSFVLNNIFQNDSNQVHINLIRNKLCTVVKDFNCNQTEDQIINVLMNFSSIINCLNELTQEEIYDLGKKLIRDNTLFFRHLLFKLQSISDLTVPNHGSNHTTPFSESVERKSYFIDLYLHTIQCREIDTCARDGCFLSKCVLSHFFRCTTNDKNINCKVCEMTRDQIKQGMIDYYNNLIMHNCVEFDPKRKRKYDREEDDQVEDEEEEVEIKKKKHDENDANENGNDIKEKSGKKLDQENENEEDICLICHENFEENNNKFEERKTTSVKNGQDVDEDSIVNSFFASCEDEEDNNNIVNSFFASSEDEEDNNNVKDNTDKKEKEDNNNVKDNTDKKEKEDNINKEDSMIVKVECCKKIYHRKCLHKWFNRNVKELSFSIPVKDNTCPSCRKLFIMPRKEKIEK